MKIRTVREFRDNATRLLRSEDPILVTRRGRLVGAFVPWPEASLPAGLKREILSVLTTEVRRQIKRRGMTEKQITADFEVWRKNRAPTDKQRRPRPPSVVR